MKSIRLGLSALLLICAACTKTIDHVAPDGATLVSSDVDHLQLPDTIKAEKLVASAEKLMSPLGFMYSYEMIQLALHFDPKNTKARFYKAYLEVLMQTKGLLYRLEPTVKIAPENTKRAYERFADEIKPGGLKDFLFSRDLPQFEHGADLEKWLQQVQEKQDAFRHIIYGLSAKVLDTVVYEINGFDEMASQCSVQRLSNVTFSVEPCPWISGRPARMEQADFVMLGTWVAAMEILTAPATSYSLDGIMQLYSRVGNDEKAGPIIAQAKTFSRLGLLKENQGMKLVQSLGVDGFEALKWVTKYRNHFCGDWRPQNVFLSLYCAGETMNVGSEPRPVDQALATFQLMMSGQTVSIPLAEPVTKQITDTRVNIMAPFLNPVKDIKASLPEFDSCDHIAAIPDATMGGIFPDENAATYFVSLKKCGPR